MDERRHTQRGFTLVEGMVTTMILAVVSVAVMQSLTSQWDFWETSMAQSDLRTAAERTIHEVSRELRSADRTAAEVPPSVSVPLAPNNTAMTFFLPTDQDGANGILDAIGNVEWNVAAPIQYQYDAPTRQLRRVQGAATTIIATDVQSVAFDDQQIDATLLANEIRVRLTLQRTTSRQRVVTASAASVVRLRN